MKTEKCISYPYTKLQQLEIKDPTKAFKSMSIVKYLLLVRQDSLTYTDLEQSSPLIQTVNTYSRLSGHILCNVKQAIYQLTSIRECACY